MQFYRIEDHSWVAIDIHHNLGEQVTLLTHKSGSNHKSGSRYCRQLLKKLQQALNVTGELMEANFPYHFITADGYTWYVSFSHSRQHAAVLISPYTNIGIDVEDSAISHQVVTRFFSPHECEWLNQKPAVNQAVLRNLLWRLKECSIKTHQNADKQLIKELKHDVLDEWGEEVINQLIGADEINDKDKPIQCVQTNAKIIGNFSSQPCSFIIVNR
ncbi:4'-phosphopantetheinyl transferase family protein [Moraxella osloensis]|uniref:4'-phosphopantetheinyl transferase family protein n=1 Tax=Faucicola osloensis TaxID=34062 RepID=UPI00242D1749|nr:4'-phosphopantetheinyl transferase superfamily protein [Moraxella osloensis]